MIEIKSFFSNRAKNWDKIHKHNDFTTAFKVSLIAKKNKGKRVLDVGCGSGIMIPFLLAQFQDVHALDISPEMTRIAAKKYPLCAVKTFDFEKKSFYPPAYFDSIVIYNAFPHFKKPELVFKNAFYLLKKNGILAIAHSLVRKKLNLTHKRAGGIVGNHILISNKKMKSLLKKTGFKRIKIIEKKGFILTAKKF